jgi:ABC-type antimicrobial peptide transport system permease subunit
MPPLFFRPLPWEYGIRNLFRRRLRSALTLLALTTVILMVLIVVGFIRGLETSLAVSGDPQVGIVFALGMGENLEYSSIQPAVADLLPARVPDIQQRYGKKYVSPELYLGSHVRAGGHDEPLLGLVRGVTPGALLVHRQVQIIEGNWPNLGEVLVGRLAPTKLGVGKQDLAVGTTIQLEGRTWRVSGVFAAGGSVFESEIWCRLDELQQAMKRQDLSLVAFTLAPGGDFADVQLFCKERQDLELQSVRQADYFAHLQQHYAPVRMLGWFVVVLVASAGVFAGLNAMYSAVLGRVRELAMLQTLGFLRRALILSLVQEGTVLASAAALLASALALLLVQGLAVRFTMSAFELRIDGLTVLIGCLTGLLLGFVGALLPALPILRLPIVSGLKEV